MEDMEDTVSLENLPYELLFRITVYLEPDELVSLLRCSSNLYHKVIPILWQHIQFFAPSKQSDFIKFSNVGSKYMELPVTNHRQAKVIAARIAPDTMAVDKLSEALLAGDVSQTALDGVQQLTLYTQNRFATEMGFMKYVQNYLLKPGFLSQLKMIRIVNDASRVIQGPNKHFFDDNFSLMILTSAVDTLTEYLQKNNPTHRLDIQLFARDSQLALRWSHNLATAHSIVMLHTEYVETVDETRDICAILEKLPNLRVFSLTTAKLRLRFSQTRSITPEQTLEVCNEFLDTLNGLKHLQSFSLISGMLIQSMDFSRVPPQLQNLELNRQITTEQQFNNLGSESETRSWKYFLVDAKYPPSLKSLRLNHLSNGSPEAQLPIDSISFSQLTSINFIGHDMPPRSDLEIFKANRNLQVVTINTISHAGLQLLTTNCRDTLRELTIAKNKGGVLFDDTEMFTNESLRSLKHCKNLEYLYIHVFEKNLSGNCIAEILEGCPFLSEIFIEYTVPGLKPYITDEEMAQYRWFEALPDEIRIPRQREYDLNRTTFKPRAEDDTNLVQYLTVISSKHEPANDDKPYIFRDFRIKPTKFWSGCIFSLDVQGFRKSLGIKS